MSKKFLKLFGIIMHSPLVLVALLIFVGVLALFDFKVLQLNEEKQTPNFKYVPVGEASVTPTPTAIPTFVPKPTVVQVYTDPDPVVDCKSSYPNCYGSTIKLKRSQCSNITCCQIGSSWSLYQSLDSCKAAQNSTQANNAPPPNNTKSVGSNFYCWINAYGYGYYTSSGDQCNADNFKYSTYKTCNDTQKLKEDNCSGACQNQLDSDRNACYYAYVQLVSDPNKYGDCLNGADSASSTYSSCLSKCSAQYAEDIKQCHY